MVALVQIGRRHRHEMWAFLEIIVLNLMISPQCDTFDLLVPIGGHRGSKVPGEAASETAQVWVIGG